MVTRSRFQFLLNFYHSTKQAINFGDVVRLLCFVLLDPECGEFLHKLIDWKIGHGGAFHGLERADNLFRP